MCPGKVAMAIYVVRQLPKVKSKVWVWIILILNIVLPGVGTMVAGCIYKCHRKSIIIGLLQLLLFPFIIGWVWSVIWGVLIVKQRM
mmetsp:Transcript_9548/g.10559  ORF Transcript_9548/g.10559 Transcript_9548/m.10559 type:complete len:86 (+) Transcript_9548:42-299(+)